MTIKNVCGWLSAGVLCLFSSATFSVDISAYLHKTTFNKTAVLVIDMYAERSEPLPGTELTPNSLRDIISSVFNDGGLVVCVFNEGSPLAFEDSNYCNTAIVPDHIQNSSRYLSIFRSDPYDFWNNALQEELREHIDLS